jgi:hypothetical protein
MDIQVVTITPEMAKNMLKKNTNNRKIRSRYLARLTDEMRKGRWKLNGDPIRINSDILIDGQHRLSAIVQSGVSIESVLITGMSSDVFDTIDCGAKRSTSDILSLSGEKNATLLGATLLLLENYRNGAHAFTASYSTTALEQLLTEEPKMRDSVKFIAGRNKKFHKIIPTSVASFCHYIFSRIDEERADDFFDCLADGKDSILSNVPYLLYQLFVTKALHGKKFSRRETVFLIIKAWNSYIKDRSLTRIVYKLNEERILPEIKMP